jgi:16S rRNA G966 N2-methylase RsmD
MYILGYYADRDKKDGTPVCYDEFRNKRAAHENVRQCDMELNTVHNVAALTRMCALFFRGVKADLILTDPPYELSNLKAGGHTELAASAQAAMNHSTRLRYGKPYRGTTSKRYALAALFFCQSYSKSFG